MKSTYLGQRPEIPSLSWYETSFIVGPQHYKKSLTASFARYPDANYLVILEEDLDISPDILTYFQQLLPVLEKDKSLYCISAWNDQVRMRASNKFGQGNPRDYGIA